MRKRICPNGRVLSGVVLAVALATGSVGQAGSLTVMGDVNAGVEENQLVFDNILVTGNAVLFSRERAQLGSLIDRFGARPGLTTTTTNAPITPGLLSGVSLLVLTAFYNAPLTYTASEMAAIRDFYENDGNVLLVAEAADAGVLAGYNVFLGALGSDIRYSGLRHNDFGTTHDLSNTVATAGVTSFELNRYNSLTGGTTMVQTIFGTSVAGNGDLALAPVPLPPALLGLGGALALLWPLRWRRGNGARRTGGR